MSDQPVTPATSNGELDKVAHTIISLANELWVLHDRQRLLEARLTELGLDLQLDGYQPPPALAAVLDSERKEFVTRLIDSLAGRATNDAGTPSADTKQA